MSNRPYDAKYEPRPGEQARGEELRHQRFLDALSLLRRVGDALGVDLAESERVARAVLGTARSLLSEKEGSDVAAQLPADLQDLWAPPA